MISCRDCWPWMKPGYITMTRRQSSNKWSDGIAAHAALKISECKNLLEKFSQRFFGINTASSYWLSSKGPNYQRGVLLISAGAIEGDFERKTPRKFIKGVLFLHDNAPAQRALATKKILANLGFQYLDHPPSSPDLAPSDYHLFPGLKTEMKVRHFSSNAEVIATVKTWLDGQFSEFFFEWLAKVSATG